MAKYEDLLVASTHYECPTDGESFMREVDIASVYAREYLEVAGRPWAPMVWGFKAHDELVVVSNFPTDEIARGEALEYVGGYFGPFTSFVYAVEVIEQLDIPNKEKLALRFHGFGKDGLMVIDLKETVEDHVEMIRFGPPEILTGKYQFESVSGLVKYTK